MTVVESVNTMFGVVELPGLTSEGELPSSVASRSAIDVTQAPYSAVSSAEDVSTPFQEAANAAKEAAYNDETRRVLLLNPRKGGYWRIKSGLTFDMAFLIVRGEGAVIDSSALTTAPAITLTGTAGKLESGEPWGDAVSGVEHLALRGPGQESAELVPGDQKVPQPVAQIPWGHIRTLLRACVPRDSRPRRPGRRTRVFRSVRPRRGAGCPAPTPFGSR